MFYHRNISHVSDEESNSINYNTFIGSPSRPSITLEDKLDDVEQGEKDSVCVGIGTTKLLSANYESLDYDTIENELFQDEERTKGHKFLLRKNLMRWIVFFFIGIVTAFVGVFIDICIHILSGYKFKLVSDYMAESLKTKDNLYIPYLIWAGINIATVFVGAVLVAYLEPVAGGSGIPQIKCYLNGVKIKNMVRVRTLFVKVIGVISTVVSGLAAGKEGPMIHAGAFVAAALSQGKSASLRTDFGILKYFREDHEKRDFVSGGAAAGVAAAFGAPIGGVLFSLEEGASFWNQSLTWRIFFASSLSAFALNIILTSYYVAPGGLSHDGLLNFGHFDNLDYQIVELPLYIVMGAIGGCLGSFYTYVNYKLTVFRMRYVRAKSLKVLEACIVAMMSATFGMIGIYSTKDCKPLGQDPNPYPVQIHCPDGEYNTMAAIWLQVPEESVRSLFHDPKASHQVWTLVMFLFTYLGLSIWTYGLSVSAGIFIPCLLTGAAWGRLIGIGLEYLLPDVGWVDPGKYALVGAAAQLGGVVRMTISLTVILIEATGNINFGLPLMITLITAKWVGDLFTEGFYDLHIQLAGVPLLGWDPPPLSTHIRASSFMSCSPVQVFTTKVKVGDVIKTLKNHTYNGFPIVDKMEIKTREDGMKTYGKLGGLILRSQLILLIKNKIYTNCPENVMNCNIEMFRLAYPQYPKIEDVEVSKEEREYYIDLSPFMNPSPYSVTYSTSLPRVFRIFRALGLRHLVIVSDLHEVVGMVTRKDIAKYRWEEHGKSGIKVLTISNAI